MSQTIQLAMPLFFDDEEKRLAYCFQALVAEATQVCMKFSSDKPYGDKCMTFNEWDHRTRMLEKGSWKNMYMSQPSCAVKWNVTISRVIGQKGRRMRLEISQYTEDNFSGFVYCERTINTLLDGLAEAGE